MSVGNVGRLFMYIVIQNSTPVDDIYFTYMEDIFYFDWKMTHVCLPCRPNFWCILSADIHGTFHYMYVYYMYVLYYMWLTQIKIIF